MSDRKDERIYPEWLKETLAYGKYVYIVMDTEFLFTELQQNEIELKFREAENKESARWVEARKITGRLNPKISAAQSDLFLNWIEGRICVFRFLLTPDC